MHFLEKSKKKGENMKKAFVYLMCCVLIVIVSGCRKEEEARIPYLKSDNGGVVVSGYNSNGFVENTNDFEVKVICYESIWDYGEKFAWFKTLKGNEKIETYIKFCNIYYVYDSSGVVIGVVSVEDE
jgi:hypothetical protein